MRRLAGIAGGLLAAGLAAYVVWLGAGKLPAVDLRAPATWGWGLAALALYVSSQGLGAMAWRYILVAHGTRLPPGRAESQSLVSQIGKYVPGNVGHLVGRYALCRQDGLPGARIGSALLTEIACLLGVGVLVSAGLLLALPVFREALADALGEAVVGPVTLLTPVALIGALALAQAYLWRRAGRPRIALPPLLIAAAQYGTNLAVVGLSVWCLTHAIPGARTVDPVTASAIFSVAWIVGFVVPGAPGGIGLRDGIVALGLGLFMGEGAALGVAVAHRLVSGLGDLVTFGAGLWLRYVTHAPEGVGEVAPDG